MESRRSCTLNFVKRIWAFLFQGRRSRRRAWVEDPADPRDHILHPDGTVRQGHAVLGTLTLPDPRAIPRRFNIVERGAARIRNHKPYNACTAFAIATLVDTMSLVDLNLNEHANLVGSSRRHRDASPLFLYTMGKKRRGFSGDATLFLRDVIQVAVKLGLPPETECPFDMKNFGDESPSASAAMLASENKATNYFRLDSPNIEPADLLVLIKRHIASGFPLAFGLIPVEILEEKSGVAKHGKLTIPNGRFRRTSDCL